MATQRAFVKAETTCTEEPARGATPGGKVYTTVVTNIVTHSTGREVEKVTYLSPTAPRGRYYGQCVGRSWTPVFKG